MSIRPFRDIKRRKTKEINVGKVKVGGDNPISVQSMTNTLTTDIKATIKQINEIQSEGADIVRVSCPDEASSKALKEIVKHEETGMNFIAGDVNSLADNIERLIDDVELRNRLSTNAMKWIEEERMWSKIVNLSVNGYQELLEN